MADLPDILDADLLWRRVPFTRPDYLREDGSPTSLAFQKRRGEDGLSVNIARLTTYRATAQDTSFFKICQFTAGMARSAGTDCRHDPLPDNFAHALVLMPDGNPGKVMAKKLSEWAEWVQEPPEHA